MSNTQPLMSSTSTNNGISDNTFSSGLGNLIKLLPTGTVFFYQFLNPILTNNGSCSTTNKYFASLLFALCGLSCFFSTFTDSYKDNQGNTLYGIATFKGFWPTSSSDGATTSSASVDFKSYRIQIGDFAHAFLSLIVFSVLSLLDSNTVQCFYPSFESTQKALLMAIPSVIGSVAAAVFAVFPSKRHGIGYPSTSSSSSSSTIVIPQKLSDSKQHEGKASDHDIGNGQPLAAGGTSLTEDDAKGSNASSRSKDAPELPKTEEFPSEYPAIKPGIAADLKFGGCGSYPNLPWVSTTSPGPNGRTISGVTYKYSPTQIKIVCACHGLHMSPEEFVGHAREEPSSPDTRTGVLPTSNPATSAQS